MAPDKRRLEDSKRTLLGAGGAFTGVGSSKGEQSPPRQGPFEHAASMAEDKERIAAHLGKSLALPAMDAVQSQTSRQTMQEARPEIFRHHQAHHLPRPNAERQSGKPPCKPRYRGQRLARSTRTVEKVKVPAHTPLVDAKHAEGHRAVDSVRKQVEALRFAHQTSYGADKCDNEKRSPDTSQALHPLAASPRLPVQVNPKDASQEMRAGNKAARAAVQDSDSIAHEVRSPFDDNTYIAENGHLHVSQKAQPGRAEGKSMDPCLQQLIDVWQAPIMEMEQILLSLPKASNPTPQGPAKA